MDPRVIHSPVDDADSRNRRHGTLSPMKQPEPALDPTAFRLTADLRRLGLDPSHEHTRVRRGVWLPTGLWAALDRTRRHAALVHATALVIDPEHPHTFCGPSAAAIWGLPRIGAWPTTCDILVGAARRGSDGIRTHRGRDADAVSLAGVLVTSAARTVIDLGRTDSLETAVAAADHALRRGLCTRDQLLQEVAALPGRARGRLRAELAVDLAEPGAMSPGESLSRVRMFQLHLPRPRLQVEQRDDAGLIGHVDFAWEGVVGEFDGRIKYAVPPDATPDQAAEIVWREKQREDRIRRSGPRVARWVWRDALARDRLLPVLAAQGVRPQARSTWFDVGARGARGSRGA